MVHLKELTEAIKNKLKLRLSKIVLVIAGSTIFILGASYVYNYYLLKRINVMAHRVFELARTIERCALKKQSIVPLSVLKQAVVTDKDIDFNFSLVQNLDKKPFERQTSDPFLPPFEAGLYITDLSQTHRLLFNKFPVVQNHLLVVTQEFVKQNTPLNKQDFSATVPSMLAMSGFCFFNSGAEAGASQPHKHLQIMPQVVLRQSSLLRALTNFARNKSEGVHEFELFDFKHALYVFGEPIGDSQSFEDTGAYLERAYEQTMRAVDNLDLKYQYNIILTNTFLLAVLRRQEKAFKLLSVNGMGFTGNFLTKTQEQLDKVIELDPFQILNDVCYPKN